jgi:glycosyltransferase involved in cell wall biosynthesis
MWRADPRVVYLCLEVLQPGQAAATHVLGITRHLGLSTELFAVQAPPEQRPRSLPRKLLDYLKLTVGAIRALRRADIAYVRAHPAALPFALAAWAMNKPAVHEVNGRVDDIGVSYRRLAGVMRVLAWAQVKQYRLATALIAVTPGLAGWLREIAGEHTQIAIIPNGADSAVFRPSEEGGASADPPYVLFFGGLVTWHGVDTMLAAIDDPAWPSHMRLAVAGHGPKLETVIEASKRNPRVRSLGYLGKAELASLAARAHAILCPIERHGSRDAGGVAPLKLFEGMAAGRPVIASDLPFQAELVKQHDCGLIFPAADPKALAAAVAALASDPQRADEMGQRGRKAVETAYDWRFRAQETATLLRACTASLRHQVCE